MRDQLIPKWTDQSSWLRENFWIAGYKSRDDPNRQKGK